MRSQFYLSALLALQLALAGCGARPFAYKPVDEIQDGPGLFSGKSGEFVLRSDKQPAAAAQSPSTNSVADYREFQEFQEFKRLREVNPDAPELREFKEWQEWKALRSGKAAN